MLCANVIFHIEIVILSSCGQDDHIISCQSGTWFVIHTTSVESLISTTLPRGLLADDADVPAVPYVDHDEDDLAAATAARDAALAAADGKQAGCFNLHSFPVQLILILHSDFTLFNWQLYVFGSLEDAQFAQLTPVLCAAQSTLLSPLYHWHMSQLERRHRWK
jgi:hypothetical protein